MLDAWKGDDCRAAAIAFATAEPLGATSGRNPAEFHDPTFRKSPYRYQKISIANLSIQLTRVVLCAS